MVDNIIMTQTQKNEDFKNQSIHNNGMIRQLATKFDAMATHSKMIET